VNAEIGKQTIEYWVRVLNAAGVPCGRVMSLPEVFADPQVRHQQMRVTIEHPVHGKLDVLGFPIKFTDDPCRVHRPPPVLGADADALLRELGYSAHDIQVLHERRIA
jgi:crotonobetainyl-CoA:carnitine CoA-transferase CaiB-like acyl-CoA transferase